MMDNGKISPLQLGVAVFMFTLGSTALVMPSIIVSIAKQDSWISILLCITVIIWFVLLWNRLSMRYPNESIVQYSERILGKWLGKMVGVMYVSFFLYLSALVLRNVGDFVTTNVLPQTPTHVVHIIFMLSIMYGAYLGLEVITRSSEVLFPWVIIIFFMTTLMLLKNIDLSKLLPILPDGWLIPVKGIYPFFWDFQLVSWLFFLIIFFPFVIQQRKIKRYFTLFAIFATIFGTLIVVISIAVLGVDIAARSIFTVFDVAKEIRVGNFF